MHTPEIVLILLASIVMLGALAERTRIASAILFLLGGLALAAVPTLREFHIAPEAILPLFLPPLLMEAAYFTSLRDFRRNLRPIIQLSVGLVVVTTVAIAYLFAWMVPGATLAAGFVLGAIISPPDAVAATSVIRTMRVPKRIVTILEGESLVNDATGLILYQFSVAAVLTASFSLLSATGAFVWMVIAGATTGIAVGWLFIKLFPKMCDIPLSILSTFVVPYASYLGAETLHGSGVLAVVATGLYVNWHAPQLFRPQFRIPAESVWKMVTFVLSALVFLLIGLQTPLMLSALAEYDAITLALYAGLTSMTAILVRFIYVFAVAYGTRFFLPRIRKRDPYPAWQNVFLVAYTGMRGVVSLATALALPVTMSWGIEFPHRALITFLALSLILFTLIIQGLLLPWVVRKLTLSFDPRIMHEDWCARVHAAQHALHGLAALTEHPDMHEAALLRIRSHYEERLTSLGDGPNTPLYPNQSESHGTSTHPLIAAEHRIWQHTLKLERDAVIGMRKRYEINDDTMNDILRELDLMATRFHAIG